MELSLNSAECTLFDLSTQRRKSVLGRDRIPANKSTTLTIGKFETRILFLCCYIQNIDIKNIHGARMLLVYECYLLLLQFSQYNVLLCISM